MISQCHPEIINTFFGIAPKGVAKKNVRGNIRLILRSPICPKHIQRDASSNATLDRSSLPAGRIPRRINGLPSPCKTPKTPSEYPALTAYRPDPLLETIHHASHRLLPR